MIAALFGTLVRESPTGAVTIISQMVNAAVANTTTQK